MIHLPSFTYLTRQLSLTDYDDAASCCVDRAQACEMFADAAMAPLLYRYRGAGADDGTQLAYNSFD